MTIGTVDQTPAGVTGSPLPEGVWSVDSQRSEIAFAVKEMWGLRTVRGVFGAFKGGLVVRPKGAMGELAIDAASLDTGHAKRDRHLRSPAFFDTEHHAWIVFTLTSVDARDGHATVTGSLAIGTSRTELEIPVDIQRQDGGSLRIDGQTALSRQAAGLAWNKLGMIRGDAMLHARLTLVREGS
jgi:polyisoprenoid-binding protein YceI